MVCIAPPSEPDWRISRIRLSSWWFYLNEDWSNFIWASTRLKSPCSRKNLFGQRISEPNVSFHPLHEGLQHAIRPYRAFHPVKRPSFSRLFSRLRHCHGDHFTLYRHRTSTFLRPFAPRPLRRFFANMDALTPDRRALRTLIRGTELPSCSDQVSLVHTARPSTHSVTNHPVCSDVAFMLPLQRVRRPFTAFYGSGFTLNEEARRTTRPNRVRYPTDCMFASGCSPPRLTATQLPSATGIGHNPGRGLSPLKSRLLPGALTPAKAGVQKVLKRLDTGFRRHDDLPRFRRNSKVSIHEKARGTCRRLSPAFPAGVQ